MTTKQFLKRKNKIIKKVTGTTLVPKDQIKNVLFKDLYINENINSKYLGGSICPYCSLYYKNNCRECPMAIAGNACEENNDSTWRIARNIWIKNSTEEDHNKLTNLIKQYNIEEGVKLEKNEHDS